MSTWAGWPFLSSLPLTLNTFSDGGQPQNRATTATPSVPTSTCREKGRMVLFLERDGDAKQGGAAGPGQPPRRCESRAQKLGMTCPSCRFPSQRKALPEIL